MEINFRVQLDYYPYDKKYFGHVTFEVPTYQTEVEKIFQCKFGHIQIAPYWGELLENEQKRRFTIWFYNDTLERLKQEIETSINEYQEQVFRNSQIIKYTRKESWEVKKDFPDPL